MSARWIAAAALGLALAGCSRQGPTPAEDFNGSEGYEDGVNVTPPPADESPPPPPVVNDVAENLDEPVEEPIDTSAQTQEDADAVGMTTRAQPNAEDEEAPVDNADEGETGGE